LVSTRNDNISRGCVTKVEFPEGRGSPRCEPILVKPEGIGFIGKIPTLGGGVWIFSGTAESLV